MSVLLIHISFFSLWAATPQASPPPCPPEILKNLASQDGDQVMPKPTENVTDASRRYYNDTQNALAYFQKIRKVRGVMSDLIDWEKNFPANAHVLDIGFGPGIEFEFLVSKGYQVDGIDISGPMKAELEKSLDQKFGLDWRQSGRLFHESIQNFLLQNHLYDRIWANASFLHVDKNELAEMISKYGQGLKASGEMYINFKVGDGPTRLDSEGRPFSDFTEESFKAEMMPKIAGLQIKKIYTTSEGMDKLGRDVRWVNLIFVPIK